MNLKIGVIIVVAILIISSIVFIPSIIGSSNEVESSFGGWKAELYAVLSNGEEKEMTLISNPAAQLFSWMHEGDEIQSVIFRLKAKATGKGFTHCELDLSNVFSDGMIWEDPGTWFQEYNEKYLDSSVLIPVNGQYTLVGEREYMLPVDNAGECSYSMEVRFMSSDNARFRGVGDDVTGEWQNEDLYIDSFFSLSFNDDDSGGNDDDPDPIPGKPITVMTSADILSSVGEEVRLFVKPMIYDENENAMNGIPCEVTIDWKDNDFSSQHINSGNTVVFKHTFDAIGQYVVTGQSEDLTNGNLGAKSSFIFLIRNSGFMMSNLMYTMESMRSSNNPYRLDDNYFLGGD